MSRHVERPLRGRGKRERGPSAGPRLERFILVPSAMLVLALAAPPTESMAGSFAQTPHGNEARLPLGCGSCHKGHGLAGTLLLPLREEDLCYGCHGTRAERAEMIRQGLLKGEEGLGNLRQEFSKPRHHPVEIAGVHTRDDALPLANVRAGRHSECTDCHDPHRTDPAGSTAIAGTVRSRSSVADGGTRSFEYELCYRCHSSQTNLPFDQRDKGREMSRTNPSYHPVEDVGRNPHVPSLVAPYRESSVISCTSCHGNDDPSGPSGPHGSTFEYLLRAGYNRKDGYAESAVQFALCYECHRRSSILGDESFPEHKLHVAEGKASCFACHNSHGSTLYPFLIDFNTRLNEGVVGRNSAGQLEFVPGGNGSGACYLRCHEVDHLPLKPLGPDPTPTADTLKGLLVRPSPFDRRPGLRQVVGAYGRGIGTGPRDAPRLER